MEQHNKAFVTYGLGRRDLAAIVLLAGGLAVRAQNTPGPVPGGPTNFTKAPDSTAADAASPAGTGTPAQAAPDKSGYNLFHPTPVEYLRDISPDRPDKTDGPFTVDAGHYQLELDFANLTYDPPNSARGDEKSESYQIAPMNIRVGVLNNADFQLELAPYTRQRVKNEATGAVETDSGFGDIMPRVKINLVGNDAGFFALGLIPFVKLPTAQNHLGNGAYEGGVGIPYAFNVPNWDVGFDTAVSYDRDGAGAGYHEEIANSVSVGRAIIGPLEYHVEFFSSVSTEQNSEWVGTVDTWFTYPVDKNLVFDGGVFIGVTKSADDWHPWMGMTWRY